MQNFENLKIDLSEGLAEVVIDRSRKANALDRVTWAAIGEAFAWLDREKSVRVVVIRGEGKGFCSGADLSLLMEILGHASALDEGEKQDYLLESIRWLQSAFNAIERCRKPVIAAVHGACFGAGVDLISSCDIRLAAQDAVFSVKEVDLAIVADVGTLQRLPSIIGEGLTRELAFTGRHVSGQEAREMRLVNHVYANADALFEEARTLGRQIARKAPMTVRGIKQVMNYSRDESVHRGLEYVATWNAGMLLSRDGREAFAAMMEKRAPKYSD